MKTKISCRLTAALALLARGEAPAADGFASVNGDTLGGTGGPMVTVSTAADFRAFATSTNRLIIQVRGTLDLGLTSVKIQSHKTIFGTGIHPGVIGELSVDGQSNVIIHNLFIENNADAGDGDGVRLIGGSHHVWIDHCTFTDCADGSVDITQGSDLVTVSWCKFNYTRDNLHNFVNLIGANDTDFGNYRLTYHHNWWSTLCKQRMPSQRFGQCHVYNSYFNCVSNQHCTAVRLQAEMRSENNFYDTVANPIFRLFGDTGQSILTSGNTYFNCTGTIDPGINFVFTPPYAYVLDATADVPSIVTNGAGAHSSVWSTVDGGGGIGAGGEFAIRGTAGQPDAGVLTGTDFSIRGGFWGLLAIVQTAGAPSLDITSSGANALTVSWPSSASGYVLQENTDLTTTNWVTASEPVQDGGTNQFVVVTNLTGNRFFRLVKP